MTVGAAELELSPSFVRPPIRVEVVETGWQPWLSVFKVHHYLLGSGPMPFSTAFTGFDVDTGDPVAFVGVTGLWAGQRRVARACRMVVHPEFQGAGIGLRFLNAVCEREWRGEGFIGAPVPSYFHTAHPALCAGLRRDPHWSQVSQKLTGDKGGGPKGMKGKMQYGGHLRSVAGFRYEGDK